ncbi:hypothetical protein DVH05_010696 [Phytophthora capsici]|nr:hypothetical protein DVH05_010696 [Phytophthora capsici]
MPQVEPTRRARQPRRLPEVIITVEDEDECVKGKEERGEREVVATKSTSRNNQAGGAFVPGNNNAAGRTSVPPLPADVSENNQTKQAVKQARRARHPRRPPEVIIIVEDECVKGKEERGEREVVATKSTSRNNQAGGALVPARNNAAGRTSVPPLPADVSENNQTKQAVKQARRARQPRRLPEVIIIVEDEDECVKGKEERGEREVVATKSTSRNNQAGGALVLGNNNAAGRTSVPPLPADVSENNQTKQAVKQARRARHPRRPPEVIIIVEDECVKGKEERSGRTSVPPLPADVSENNQTKQAVKQARRARQPRRLPEVIIIVEDEDECVKGKEERGEREVVATKSTSRNNQARGAFVPRNNNAAGRTSVPPLPADVSENNQTKQPVKQTGRARQPRRLPEVIIIVEDEDECVKGKEERGEREVVATKSTSRNNQAGGALVPARNNAAGQTSVPPLPADVSENNQTQQAVKQARRARHPRRPPEVIIIVEMRANV